MFSPFLTCVSFHVFSLFFFRFFSFLFFLKKKFFTFGQVARYTSVSVGRDTEQSNQSFRIYKVNLATLEVARTTILITSKNEIPQP